jgi:c-di-GMP-binding flagellar brake protein YcgR
MAKRSDAGKYAHQTLGMGDFLFRSQIEIKGVLDALAQRHVTISAEIENDRGEKLLLLTRLLHVDPAGQFIIIACSRDKPANHALIGCAALVLHANLDNTHIEFAGADPAGVMFRDVAAIRLRFPDSLLRLRRREHPRFHLPPSVPLRCVADSGGFTPFEARITDISIGGMGAMIYGTEIKLSTGTVLKSCKIVHPGGDAVVVDLEVRYSVRVIMPDGEWVHRSGFRFLQQPPGLAELLKIFVLDLDQPQQP